MKLMRRVAALLPFLLALSAPPCRGAEQMPGVDLLWGVKIPMRDGVKLNATVYRPHGQEGPLPVIFELTPYISDSYHERAYYFAQHSYVFAIVDVRGRGNSEGRFDPFYQEPADGHDVVEWLAAQPWSNGKVAMWGGSYAGFDQWLTLREEPPHLVTIVPAAAAHVGVDFPMFHNVFYSYVMQWLTFTSGVTGNGNLFGESSFWRAKFGEMYREHRPFRELDRIVGNTSTVFQEWLAHPEVDAHMKTLELTPEQYGQIGVPILTITGSYDGDQAGAMAYYRSHMRYGTEAAKARHYLIIGPWDHAGTRTPSKEVGGLTFGDNCLLDLNKLHTEWYDWTMKSGPKPEFLEQRVAYYVMGANEWKYADSLDATGKQTRTLYLDSSDGRANDVFASGRLSGTSPGSSTPDHYSYDPLDTRPAALEEEDVKSYLTDQRAALNLFGNGLVYHSEPFAADTEISGFVRLELWMSIDVPDTDLAATLYEIRQDGTSIQLTGDLMRARYRESLSQAKLVTPGAIERYEFSGFTFFSRRIAKGSRLRLLIACPNTRDLEKNYNSGGVVADETAKDARTAHVMLYHDARHPSRLQLPVAE
jgi:putative CocE/NonD family hydrolase